ncbi:MAG: site-specific integrase [Patescibacteria group bacterium]
MSSLPNSFKTYLKLQGFSSITVRNYLSDLNHFLGWLELTLRSRNLPVNDDEPQLMRLYLKEEFILGYKSFLLANSLPLSTVNRRLSTLRTFGKFCLSQAWISENPTKQLSNVAIKQSSNKITGEEKILEEFRKHLEAEKTSSNTIKNYLSDIRAFLTWAEIAT